MIEARNLSKSFGDNIAVRDVSLTIHPGEVVGFLGPNGAGKSTTMRLLSGALVADRGTASIGSFNITSQRVAAQNMLGYMPEAATGFPDLTVREFLTFCAEARQIAGSDAQRRIDEVSERTFLAPALNKTMRTLSKGWRQRAWFAQAVLHKPAALILDEPTDGLDPGQKDHIRDYIREISATTAIVLSTHVLSEAEEMCNRVIIITEGTVVKNEKTSALLDKRGRLASSFAELTTTPNAA